jgi:hypothetical protein
LISDECRPTDSLLEIGRKIKNKNKGGGMCILRVIALRRKKKKKITYIRKEENTCRYWMLRFSAIFDSSLIGIEVKLVSTAVRASVNPPTKLVEQTEEEMPLEVLVQQRCHLPFG